MKNHKNTDLLFACGEKLIDKKLTMAFAESATAGRICAAFALVPDAGKFLKGGIVCYDAGLKTSILGVCKSDIETYSPESAIVTQGITTGLRQLISADIYIGCTGLTCPGGSETAEKPVGTMFLHAINKDKLLFSERMLFNGNPEEIILQTVQHTSKLLYTILQF